MLVVWRVNDTVVLGLLLWGVKVEIFNLGFANQFNGKSGVAGYLWSYEVSIESLDTICCFKLLSLFLR